MNINFLQAFTFIKASITIFKTVSRFSEFRNRRPFFHTVPSSPRVQSHLLLFPDFDFLEFPHSKPLTSNPLSFQLLTINLSLNTLSFCDWIKWATFLFKVSCCITCLVRLPLNGSRFFSCDLQLMKVMMICRTTKMLLLLLASCL